MADVIDYLDHNKIRIIVCLLLLALGLYVVNTIKGRRGLDNLWIVSLFITVAAVIGMWFTLAGTVTGKDQDSKKDEQPDPQELNSSSRSRLVSPFNLSLPLIELVYSSPTMLVVDFLKEMAVSGVHSIHKLGKRACEGPVCPVLVGGKENRTKRFFRKNKTRLITTSTTTTAGGTGAYAKRKADRRAVLVGVILTIGLAVGLWFLIGEDAGQDSDEVKD